MKFCGNCGEKIEEGKNFCPACGKAVDEKKTEKKEEEKTEKKVTAKEGDNTKLMGVLSYIVFFIPLLTGSHKKSTFVKYHVNQGIILAIFSVAYSIVANILMSVIKVNGSCGTWFGYDLGNYCKVTPIWLRIPLNVVYIGISALCVIGIINVVKGRKKTLPIIGKFTIIK